MGKQSGIGDNLYVGGYNLSGDTQSFGRIGGGPAALDLTGIDKGAPERRGGLRDGGIDWVAFFNKAAGAAHPVLSALPRTDEIVSYFRGTGYGRPAASQIGKQIGYDPSRTAAGDLSLAIATQANAYGLEWGEQLTPGILQLTTAGAGTGVDFAAASSFGLQAYLHVFAFTGTSATVAIQSSSDNAIGDPYANVTDGAFAAATAIGAQRIQTARNAAIERWLRVNVTGVFTVFDFAVVVVKNSTEVLF